MRSVQLPILRPPMSNRHIYGDLKVLYGKRYRLASFPSAYKLYKRLTSSNHHKLVSKLSFVHARSMTFFMIDKVTKQGSKKGHECLVSDNRVVWTHTTETCVFRTWGQLFFQLEVLITCQVTRTFVFAWCQSAKKKQQENREALIRNHADSHASDKIRQGQSSVKEKDKPKVQGFKEYAQLQSEMRWLFRVSTKCQFQLYIQQSRVVSRGQRTLHSSSRRFRKTEKEGK